MRIAVTYDNGQVFQHFGRTEQFKLYDVENGLVTVSEVIGNEGLSHHALADLLREKGVDLLICGGIGQGGADALENAGVKLVSGAEGSADEAVRAWLRGELESREANCREHGEEHRPDAGENEPVEEEAPSEEVSGEEEEGDPEDCTSNCGTCPHHCARELMPGKNSGKTVRVHYRGTFNDGTQFDSSYDRGEPLEFICGAGMMIEGFDKAVVDMEPGEVRNIHLMPEEAYGQPDPAAIFTLRFEQLPGSEALEVGEHIHITNSFGAPFPVVVKAKDESTITLDANHEMAGKELNFKVELVEVL